MTLLYCYLGVLVTTIVIYLYSLLLKRDKLAGVIFNIGTAVTATVGLFLVATDRATKFFADPNLHQVEIVVWGIALGYVGFSSVYKMKNGE